MKIVIFGGHGQLGKDLSKTLLKGHSVISLSRNECDLTNKSKTKEICSKIKPDIIINTAAYTNVDKAEKNFLAANEINNISLKYLSDIANTFDSLLIHFSTDYVFNGSAKVPIKEDDFKDPINAYGQTKHLGEEQVKKYCKKYFIFRISWVYGNYGKNFPTTIMSLAKTNKELRIINDQYGVPTSTKYISSKILDIINSDCNYDNYGIYNLSPTGYTSWYGFAQKIIDSLVYNKLLREGEIKLIPITSKEFNTIAERPKFSVLDNAKLIKTFRINTLNWETCYDQFFKEYKCKLEKV